jgi:TPR repeat protein
MRAVGFILVFVVTASVAAADLSALRKQAAEGKAAAQYQLGELLYEARKVARDLDAARRWTTQAAEQGHARAQYRLASMQLLGEGGPRDVKAGMALFKKCLPALTKESEAGQADAQGKLGILFARGVGVKKDPNAATQWFSKAAKQGNIKAQADLASAYLTGQGIEANPTQAGQWFTRAAEAGHGPAMIHLASLELQGRGRRQNLKVGKQWLMKAAAVRHPGDAQRARTLLERLATRAPQLLPDMDALIARAGKGEVDAQLELARRHETGAGLPVDTSQTIAWYLRAIQLGSPEAAHRLGGMFALGRGMKKDSVRAGRFWSLSARLGYPAAQIDWGVMCAKGEGTPRDPAEAYYWFVVARQSVSDPKQIATLDQLQALVSTELTPDEVFDIPPVAGKFIAPKSPALRKAMALAEYGDGASQFELAQALAEGTGLQKDSAAAFVWFSLAAKQKVKNAANAREALKISEKEKSTAQKKIKAFKPLSAPEGG